MLEADDIHNGLPMLLAVACLLVASRYTFWLRKSWFNRPSRPREKLAPEIDGTQLYYGGKRWPQYEARFNLRLSYVYGPVVLIRHQSTTQLARLKRWFDRLLCRTQDGADTTVLINSLSTNERALKGLIASCASRRPSIPAGKYLSRGHRIVLQPYGPEWILHRRVFTSLLTKHKITTKWIKALRHEAMVMVGRIAELGAASRSPADATTVLDEVSRFTASSVLQITYARRAETPDDPILRDLQVVSQNIASAFTPGKYWVEDLPLLDIFPAFVSPWKRKLTADHRFEMALFEGLLLGVEARLDERQGEHGSNHDKLPGQAGGSVIAPEECAAAELLRTRQFRLEREDIAYLAAGIFEAGTETTAMTINTFLLAAACYPGMTRRAQAEIDELMSSKDHSEEMVPTFADLQQLPYLGAVVKEALRLTPTGSSGVGHTPSKPEPQFLDLDCDGVGGTEKLAMPPRATVLANTYGLHHDHERYPDPWRFDPGRWMMNPPDPNEEEHQPGSQKCSTSSYSLDHTHAGFAFGFGRRICPGSSLASHSLSMATALLLLCFDFELTDRAEAHRHAVEKQDREEFKRWAELFPGAGAGAQVAMDRERASRLDHEDEGDRIGKGLIDAHIAFKLSREQLAECIRLKPRQGKPWLKVVDDALASTWAQ